MNVYVLCRHWNGESYGHWLTTILGVYSSENTAMSLMHMEMDKVDQEDASEYRFTVEEFTLNHPVHLLH